MSDSTLSASGFTAVVVATAGYMSGDYTSILFGAIAGSFWPLAGANTTSRWHGAGTLLKLVMTALALTGFVVHVLKQSHALSEASTSFVLMPTAFVIAAFGDRWVRIFDSLANGLVLIIETAVNAVISRIQGARAVPADVQRDTSTPEQPK